MSGESDKDETIFIEEGGKWRPITEEEKREFFKEILESDDAIIVADNAHI